MVQDTIKNISGYGYMVFNYSPSPLSDAGTACLVVVVKRRPPNAEDIDIYLMSMMTDVIDGSHYEYVQALAEDCRQLATSCNLSTYLEGAGELSMGPLRTGVRGTCSSEDLPGLLESLFSPHGYALQPHRRPIPIRSDRRKTANKPT